MKKNIVSLIALILIDLPSAALADTGVQNPLNPNFSTIPKFIAGFLQVVTEVALPIIGLFLVIAGFKFISAQGNSEAINSAKSNFMYVIFGALLILGAWVIATLIGNTISQLTSFAPSVHPDAFAFVLDHV